MSFEAQQQLWGIQFLLLRVWHYPKNYQNLKILPWCFGEGATEEGVFSETLNITSIKELPLIFFVENNGYSVYSPLSPRQSSNRHITKISRGYV